MADSRRDRRRGLGAARAAGARPRSATALGRGSGQRVGGCVPKRGFGDETRITTPCAGGACPGDGRSSKPDPTSSGAWTAEPAGVNRPASQRSARTSHPLRTIEEPRNQRARGPQRRKPNPVEALRRPGDRCGAIAPCRSRGGAGSCRRRRHLATPPLTVTAGQRVGHARVRGRVGAGRSRAGRMYLITRITGGLGWPVDHLGCLAGFLGCLADFLGWLADP
jgi:hypothetical protein